MESQYSLLNDVVLTGEEAGGGAGSDTEGEPTMDGTRKRKSIPGQSEEKGKENARAKKSGCVSDGSSSGEALNIVDNVGALEVDDRVDDRVDDPSLCDSSQGSSIKTRLVADVGALVFSFALRHGVDRDLIKYVVTAADYDDVVALVNIRLPQLRTC